MFSIVVCSHRPERAAFVRAHFAALFRDHAHEFILIQDASSLGDGYTRGFGQSRGNYVVFSHDDIEFITPDAATRIERHLSVFDVIGVAGTTRLIDGAWTTAGDPHCFALVVYPEADDLYSVRYTGAGPLCVPGIQALDGCFLACRRDVVAAVGFDGELFDGFHLYDLDFTFRAFLKGFRLAVCRDLALIHASVGNHDDVWRGYCDQFVGKHRAHLAPGEAGSLNVVSARLNKTQVAALCVPEYLQSAIRWS